MTFNELKRLPGRIVQTWTDAKLYPQDTFFKLNTGVNRPVIQIHRERRLKEALAKVG